jgi:hypothetical protein
MLSREDGEIKGEREIDKRGAERDRREKWAWRRRNRVIARRASHIYYGASHLSLSGSSSPPPWGFLPLKCRPARKIRPTEPFFVVC